MHPSAPNNSGGDLGPGSCQLAPGVVVPSSALRFTFTASGGPGGQNVNKRATRAEMRVWIADLGLSPAAADRLRRMASHRVTTQDELVIDATEHRSQAQNRAECLDRLGELVLHALVEPKKRKKTKPTKGSKLRRLEGKKHRSSIKRGRGGGGMD
jgi:ribosome-associated protein